MLPSTFIAIMLTGARAVTLNPTADGLSVPGVFFSKLDARNARQRSIPFPPPPVGDTPCYQGGDYCGDYDTAYDPCNKFTCGP
jgi:hypothetical protein